MFILHKFPLNFLVGVFLSFQSLDLLLPRHYTTTEKTLPYWVSNLGPIL